MANRNRPGGEDVVSQVEEGRRQGGRKKEGRRKRARKGWRGEEEGDKVGMMYGRRGVMERGRKEGMGNGEERWTLGRKEGRDFVQHFNFTQ